MNQLVKDMLGNKVLRGIMAAFMACLIALSMLPSSLVAYGDPAAPQDGADSEDLLAAVATMVMDDASETYGQNDAPGGKPGDKSGVTNVAPSSDEGDGTDVPDADDPTKAKAQSNARVGDAPTPTWVTASNGAKVEFDPASDAGATKATVTGTGTITVNLATGQEYTLVIDGTVTGDITVPAGTTLNLQGTGTLQGTGNGSVITVEGNGAELVVGTEADVRKAAGVDCLTITGGTGSQLHTDKVFEKSADRIFKYVDETAGGAILVRRLVAGDKANLVINNVNITGNYAQGGGGIYIDRDSTFTMYNGLVTGNSTKDRSDERKAHEGGGIAVAGLGYIYKGQITNNSTATSTDWGGGGIFIESQGKVYFGDEDTLSSVLITKNEAKGLGGGISGCPHARTGIGPIGGSKNAIAIFDNVAAGEEYLSFEDNQYLWNLGGKGDHIFFNKDIGDGKFAAADGIVENAKDFYCTYASVIGQQNFVTLEGYSWKGKYAYAGQEEPADVTINNETPIFSIANASVGLTAGIPDAVIDAGDFDVVITGNTSTTHGGGIGCNGILSIGTVPDKSPKPFKEWSFDLNKEFTSLKGESLIEGDQFTFGLYEEPDCSGEPLKVAKNDVEGLIRFTVEGDDYLPSAEEVKKDYPFYVKELVPQDSDSRIEYDKQTRKVVVTVSRVETTTNGSTGAEIPWKVTTVFPRVDQVTYYVQDENGSWVKDEDAGSTFRNVFSPTGTFVMKANKEYYGKDLAESTGRFSFTMQRIDKPVDNMISASSLGAYPNEKYTGTNGAFNGNEAEITFKAATLESEGDFWYAITEEEADGVSTDSRVYVIKVVATLSTDGRTLESQVAEVYYAEAFVEDGTELNRLENDRNGNVRPVEFMNFGNDMQSMRLYGYAINAASDKPIEQQCFVDPKIIKNLEGRTLTEGEFNFKLIQLVSGTADQVDWSVTQGDTISETTNDRYGMVDFDKANNLSGDWENPSCLVFYAPGIYNYRVVEANGTTDASVEYSDQIITFTAVIERDGQGQLVCTDMYYGHVENGVYSRYDESDNPQWHPTMTNYAKGMDLQVRKTSALDRENGLEGATYGLYAVNDSAQADILLGEATSDVDGWITFEDVALKEGTLYYFKERLAPAGHTVSEFRSGFFYLVKDSTAPNGYVMRYTDSKSGLAKTKVDTALLAMAEDDATFPSVSKDGDMLFTYARDGGVYDEATLVEFNKLDTRTHEWVEGAELAIIDKASGETVNEWTSGKASEKLEGKLDVDTTYILRELSAPEGYAKAGDVEFTIGQYGAVSILSGTSNGNAEIQDSTITLYDTMLDVENTVTEYREVPGDDASGSTSKEGTTTLFGMPVRTGDLLKIGGVLAVAVAAIVIMLLSRKRRKPLHSHKR